MIPEQLGISRQRLNVGWDARVPDADVWALLEAREPNIAAILGDIGQACPVAETARAFEGAHFVRPAGHARSFLLRLTQGVLVFKGTEPFSTDYREIFAEAWQARDPARHSAMEHFAISEDEVYLGLTKRMAVAGARRTWEWVAAHSKLFHELPRTPVPLLVFDVPEDAAHPFGAALLPLLTDRAQFSARRKVEGLLAEGLGVYVYYYPGTPIRLAHALGSFPGSFGIGVNDAAPVAFDIDAAVESWVELFARMLIAGFVPTTAIHTGNCLQAQNVAIDGGLCDLDSLEPIASFAHQRDLAGALSVSLAELTQTVRSATSLPYEMTAAYLWEEIVRRTRARAKSVPCDPRIAGLVALDGLAGLRWLARAAED